MRRLMRKLLNSESFVIASLYAFFGAMWIFITDMLSGMYFEDIERYKRFQTIKGWVYIFITTIMVFILIHRRMKIYREELQRTDKAYKKLSIANDELIKTEEELSFQKEFTESIIRDAPVIIMPWDDQGRILSLNPFGEKLLGYEEDELVDSVGWEILIPKEHKFVTKSIFNKLKTEDRAVSNESSMITKSGKTVDILWSSQKLNQGKPDSGDLFVSIGTDMQERKVYENKIRNMAYYDPLTELPNKALFDIMVDKYVVKEQFITAYMDIDNFKDINDSVGHHAGDEFLQYLADCLRAEVKEPDIISRTGGDEFAILFLDKTLEEVYERLENILNRISETWIYNKRLFYISFSIGIVIYPDHGENSKTLFKNADIAMYEAKRRGKNQIVLYKDEFAQRSLHMIKMTTDLQYGIENDQFTLFFQPQYDLCSGKIIGAEALARWYHPEKGLIPPIDFISLAEDTGHIYKLERLIFRKALDQKKRMEEEGYSDLSLSINLSTKTLTSKTNFEMLEKLILQYSVDFNNVIIEVTESANVTDVEFVKTNLNRLKVNGIRIALDDFGTGYASLNHLKVFPIDVIKLDRTFINAVPGKGIENHLIISILKLAKDLEYDVIAEGIETKEQLDYLIENVCGWGQGFLLSKPLPRSVFEDLIEENFTV